MENNHIKWILILSSNKVYHTGEKFNKLPINIQNTLLRYYNRHICTKNCLFIFSDKGYYCHNLDFDLEEDYERYLLMYVFGGTHVEFMEEFLINTNGVDKIGKPSLDI